MSLKALLLAAGLAVAGAALGSAEEPSALLWVPAGVPDVAGLEALLARRPSLKLGIALSPEDLPAGSSSTLARLWSEGRVEPLLRLAGDPILPLSPFSRRELTPRLTAARAALQRALERPVAGFAPGGGALDGRLARQVKAAGVSWVVGSGTSTAPYAASGLEVLPGRAVGPAPAGLAVVDEGSGLLASGAGLAALDAAAEAAGSSGWALPSALAGEPAPGSNDRPDGRSWAGDLSPWNGGAAQQRTLKRLEEAAAALQRYQNSGTASIETLDSAGTLLAQAESGRALRSAEEKEAETNGLLIRFYEALGQRPPLELLASTAAASAAGLVTSESEPGRLAFNGPSGASGPCAIDRLEVRLEGRELRFAVTLATSAATGKPPRLDIYIDVNNRPGAGSARLLAGRPGFVRSVDAWEYALELGEESRLYRFVPPKPSPVDRLASHWDPEARTLSTAVPAERIKGNFATWGYLAACVDARPPKESPLGQPEGEVLAVLGTRAESRQLEDPKRKARARLSAQRLTPAEASKVR